jgi:hypothetical protein
MSRSWVHIVTPWAVDFSHVSCCLQHLTIGGGSTIQRWGFSTLSNQFRPVEWALGIYIYLLNSETKAPNVFGFLVCIGNHARALPVLADVGHTYRTGTTSEASNCRSRRTKSQNWVGESLGRDGLRRVIVADVSTSLCQRNFFSAFLGNVMNWEIWFLISPLDLLFWPPYTTILMHIRNRRTTEEKKRLQNIQSLITLTKTARRRSIVKKSSNWILNKHYSSKYLLVVDRCVFL